MFGSYSFPEPTNNHKVIPVTGCYAYQLATYLGGREDHKIGLDANPNPGNYNHYYSKKYIDLSSLDKSKLPYFSIYFFSIWFKSILQSSL